MVDLKAPQDLAYLYRLWETKTLQNPKSDLWLDWLGETHDEWHATNKRLEKEALGGDGSAIIKLVARDHRYLGTELVQAKLIHARTVLWEKRDRSVSEMEGFSKASESRKEREEEARKFLNGIANAITSIGTGRGTLAFPPTEILHVVNSIIKQLQRLWAEATIEWKGTEVLVREIPASDRKGMPSRYDDVITNLAVEYGVPKKAVSELLIGTRGPVKHAAILATAEQFGTTEEAIKQTEKRYRKKLPI